MLALSFVRVINLSTMACLALFVCTLLWTQPLKAETKVLKYDKSGKITGSQSYQNKTKQSAPTSSPSKRGSSDFDPDTAYERGVLILMSPPQGYADKIRTKGFRVIEHVSLGNLGMSVVRIEIPSGMDLKTATRTLGKILPGVTIDTNTHFDPSATGYADRKTANPRSKAGWNMLSKSCGRGLILGQIDAGVDVNHPALKGQNITYRSFTKAGRKASPDGHGTSIAAMLVGKPEWGGLQPGAKLFAANFFEINETGKTVGSAVGLLQAVNWLVTQNVHAINLSIAGGDNKIVRQAFEFAKKKNIILVASVGNWGRSDKPAFPAAYKHVIAVTAIKDDGRIYTHANTGNYVDFAEPGVEIYTATAGGGGKARSGTSYGAPYVTVMAAILTKAGKAAKASDLRKILSKVTVDLGKPGKDKIFGFGKIKVRPVCNN